MNYTDALILLGILFPIANLGVGIWFLKKQFTEVGKWWLVSLFCTFAAFLFSIMGVGVVLPSADTLPIYLVLSGISRFLVLELITSLLTCIVAMVIKIDPKEISKKKR